MLSINRGVETRLFKCNLGVIEDEYHFMLQCPFYTHIILSYSCMLSHLYLYYRVIALILAHIVPSLDIEGRELASVRRYQNEGQYSQISVR